MKFYHASPYPLEDKILTPRTRGWHLETASDGREFFVGRTPRKEDTPYLFVSNDLQHAATYAVTKGVRLGNLAGLESGIQVLLIDRESIIGDPEMKGGLYTFKSDQFRLLIMETGPTDQWVSTQPLDLRSAVYTPVTSLNDIMKIGVQIYQIAERPDYDADAFYREHCKADSESDIQTLIQNRLADHCLRWMNQERDISPLDPFQVLKTPADKDADTGNFPVRTPALK